MSTEARMWRVVCNRCKGRGHFGRDCPNKDNKSSKAKTFEPALGEAEAALEPVNGPSPSLRAGARA